MEYEDYLKLKRTPDQDRSVGEHAQDLGASLATGVAAIPAAISGAADLATSGLSSRALNALNVNPSAPSKAVSEALHTDQYKEKQQEFANQQGFGAKLGYALKNPTIPIGTVVESLPQMVGGAGVGRLIQKANKGMKGTTAMALGEGAMEMGALAENIRQGSEGELSSGQRLGAALGGALTGAFTLGGSALARRLGIGDIDELVYQGFKPQQVNRMVANEVAALPAKSVPRKMIEGAIAEGLLEELPQELSQQLIQNIATDRPWDENLDGAAVLGMLSGGIMGATSAPLHARHGVDKTKGSISRAAATAIDNGAIDNGAVQDNLPATIQEEQVEIIEEEPTRKNRSRENDSTYTFEQDENGFWYADGLFTGQRGDVPPRLTEQQRQELVQREPAIEGELLEPTPRLPQPNIDTSVTIEGRVVRPAIDFKPSDSVIQADTQGSTEVTTQREIDRINSFRGNEDWVVAADGTVMDSEGLQGFLGDRPFSSKEIAQKRADTMGKDYIVVKDPRAESYWVRKKPTEMATAEQVPALEFKNEPTPTPTNASVNLPPNPFGEPHEEFKIDGMETIPYDTIRWDGDKTKKASGETTVIDMAGRQVAIVNVNGVKVPFYLSTGSGGKKDVKSGKWYPVFGVASDGWLNKTSGDEINNYYGSSELRKVANDLDRTYGSNVSGVKVNLSGRHRDFINQGLGVTAVENGFASTPHNLRRNISDVIKRIEDGRPTIPQQSNEAPTNAQLDQFKNAEAGAFENFQETVELPLDQLKLSQEVAQFKEGADSKTGVVEPLTAKKYDRTGTAPISVWVRNDGSMEVITGRHRLDLARRTGEKTIPSQIFREKDGFTVDDAKRLDAELNIRDEQGSVTDFTKYFRNNETYATEEDAQNAGLLSRNKGRQGYTIATKGSDLLIDSMLGGNNNITEQGAFRIAEAFPNDATYQQTAISRMQKGDGIAKAISTVQSIKAMNLVKDSSANLSQETIDLFSSDPASDAYQDMAVKMGEIARKKQDDLSNIIKIGTAPSASKSNIEAAKALGIDINNPEATRQQIEAARAELNAWKNWHTNPAMTEQVTREALGESFNLTTQTEEELAAQAAQLQQTEQAAIAEQNAIDAAQDAANIRQLAEVGVANFELGQDPLDSLSGQQSILTDDNLSGQQSTPTDDNLSGTAMGHGYTSEARAQKRADTLAASNVHANFTVVEKDGRFWVEKKEDDSKLFRRAPNNGKTYTKAEVESIVNSTRQSWRNAPKMRTVEAKDVPNGMPDDAKSYFDAKTDEVVIIADRHNSQRDVLNSVFHETIGHYGMRKVFGAELDAMLDDIARMRPDDIARKAADYNIDVLTDTGRRIAAEEFLADMTGRVAGDEKLTIVQKFFNMVRNFVRSMGFNVRLSDNEIRQLVIEPAQQYIENGRVEQVFANYFKDRPTIRKIGDVARYTTDKLNKVPTPPESWTDGQKQSARHVTNNFDGNQRGETFLNNMLERVNQSVFDQFAAIKRYSKEAFMQSHLSRGTEGGVETMLRFGMLKLKDGALQLKGMTSVTDADGNVSFKNPTDTEGFLPKLGKILGQDQNMQEFFLWQAASRAEQLMADGREQLFTIDDINNFKAFANTPEKLQRFKEARTLLAEYNKSVLDIAEQAGLVDGSTRGNWESDLYIPFYRVSENGDGSTLFGKSNAKLVRQDVIKRLRGGDEKLGDLMTNIVTNWQVMLQASMRNIAANNTIDAMGDMATPTTAKNVVKNTIWTLRNGERVYYDIHDRNVFDALEALSFNGFSGATARVLAGFKGVLTAGVTIDPSFRIRNTIRDTMHAMAVTDVGYNPVKNLVQGWKMTEAGSPIYKMMMAGGGTIRFGAFNDGNQSLHIKRMMKYGFMPEQILDTKEKMQGAAFGAWKSWQEFGDRSEAITRSVVYKRVFQQTGNHLEASYAARDVMNFTSQGSSQLIRFFSQSVPFFNARMQGLSKLGRGFQEDPRRFTAVVGTIALASVALMAVNGGGDDSDEYWALPDYVRNTYWPIKLGGTWFFIPKPFEVGALATVIERSTEYAARGKEYDGKDFLKSIGAIASDQLAMNITPQVVKPMVENYFNYDMFRQTPIDSITDMNHSAPERYRENTSQFAVSLGSLIDASPQRIDHMMRGYFGWVGAQVLNVSDIMMRPMTDRPASLSYDFSRAENYPVIGNFIKSEGGVPNKYVNDFYQSQALISQIYNDANAARSRGDLATYEAKRLELSEAGGKRQYDNVSKRLNKINKQIRLIESDRQLSVSLRNQMIKDLRSQRNEITQDFRNR